MYLEKINEKEIHCHLSKKDLDMRGLTLKDLLYDIEKSQKFTIEISKMAYSDFGFHVRDSKITLLPFSDFSKDYVVFSFKTIQLIT